MQHHASGSAGPALKPPVKGCKIVSVLHSFRLGRKILQEIGDAFSLAFGLVLSGDPILRKSSGSRFRSA